MLFTACNCSAFSFHRISTICWRSLSWHTDKQ